MSRAASSVARHRALSDIARAMGRIAIYAGTFDPLTVGHVSIVRRGLRIFDEIVIAVAENIRKSPLFSVDERIALIDDVFAQDLGVRSVAFDGLLVDLAANVGAVALLRGLRNAADFDYEAPMVHMNRRLAPDVETVFVCGEQDETFVSSSLIKEVARFGGDITPFVPAQVLQPLLDRIAERT